MPGGGGYHTYNTCEVCGGNCRKERCFKCKEDTKEKVKLYNRKYNETNRKKENNAKETI